LKDPKKIVVCPGVFDGLTARIALSKGFDALYMVCATSPICNTLRGDDDGPTDYLILSSDRRWNVHVKIGLG
jgi:2-methylisocitrate lyase-like PEP mutase family enzyme